ncbi:hypothetical protein OF829_10980 [Sphingomonas sp. LB-2]|uniref:hypothetical protein n=1 Tax=Sphingomonas caeni TaxID=2984949 RepID=UPI002230950D|nr:hypothetical protein [Sphingomonas caeni]MCW3847765.1 hypothetical protein [Sphingomonas caeni]
MRKLLIAAAFAPAALFLTAAAPAQDILDQLADKASELFKEKGLSPTGWVSNGGLAEGGQKTVSVTLKGGSVYSVVGMCDGDCGDLNLRVTDSSGNVIGEDLKDDDFPLIVTDKSGTFQATVSMVKCKVSQCRYRLMAFSQ